MVTACSMFGEHFIWTRQSFEQLQGFSDENAMQGLKALQASCERPKEMPIRLFDMTIEAAQWQTLCEQVGMARMSHAKAFFIEHFDLYQVTTNKQLSGLLTGYYVPLLRGSLTRDSTYHVPLYAKPSDSVRTTHNRAAIETGALDGRGLELIYLDDAVDAFFLHIQGSGKVQLPNGDMRLLRYAGKNEFPYTAIGKQFIAEGVVSREDMSLDWLKDWLRSNPEQAATVMQRNASYIFFELVEAEDAIIGADGSALTPMHSIAIDPAYLGYGLPLYLATTLPDGSAFESLVVTQDTGSAIKGRLRADLFTGTGDKAEALAGALQADTIFYALLPKGLQR